MEKSYLNKIRTLEKAGNAWDFFEDADDAVERAKDTVSGIIASDIKSQFGEKVLGLCISFAAKRSLVCWFEYCTDMTPLKNINSLIDLWLADKEESTPIEWTKEVEPKENGTPIVDCRYSDTSSASSSVAHAARYARFKDIHFATIAISHAMIAFETSPVGSEQTPDLFSEWLCRYSVPLALEHRDLVVDELFELADFKIRSDISWDRR